MNLTVPKIDFYVLPDHTAQGRALLACRLAEKAYSLGHKVYIHTPEQALAEQINDLLWTFRQQSFVPHSIYPPAADDASPVLIGWQGKPDPKTVTPDVLINLAAQVPEFFTEFQRVVEIVDQDPQSLSESRQRFRIYREHGCEPSSHRL